MRNSAWLAVLLAACGGGNAEPADHAAGHPGAGGEHAGHGGHGHGGHGHGHGGHGGHHHDFSDVERFAAIFDDPARDEWQRPAEIVSLLALSEDMTVADLGAGTGYFAPHLSTAVGEGGRVLALDVEPAMVDHMRTRFAEAGLTNAEAQVVEQNEPGLAEGSVDRVLIVDTWHHISDREAYAGRLRSALRPGGFVLVVDFTLDSPHGPPAAMRLEATAVAAELQAGGLSAQVVEQEQLPYQYVVRADLR